MRSLKLFVFVVLLAGSVFPQQRASLGGAVRGADGAPAPGVRVVLEDPRIGGERVAVTAADGGFVFDDLLPGSYVVRASAGDDLARVTVDVTPSGAPVVELRLAYASPVRENVDVQVSSGSSQPFDEVAKTVDIIGNKEVAVRGDLSLADTLRTIPGFRVQQLGGFGRTASIKSRGLRNQDTAVLIDGMRFRDPSSITGDASAFISDLSVTGADRIEVLRGSGSSVYGTNAIGGVIDLRTKEPAPGFRGEVTGGFGGLGLGNGRASVSGGSSKLLGTASISRTAFTKGIDGNDEARNTGFQGRLDFKPSSSTFISGRVMLSRAFVMLNVSPDTAGDPGTGIIDAVPGFNFLPDRNDPDNSQRSDFLLGRLTLTHIFDPRLFLTVSYQGLATKRTNNNGPLGPGFQPFGGTETSIFEGHIDTFETRLNWTPAAAKLVTFGFEMESEDYRNEGLGPSSSSAFYTDSGQSSLTFFAQHLAGFFDGRLQLAGGARLQRFRLGTTSFSAENAPYQGLSLNDPPNAVTLDGAASYLFRSTGTKLRSHAGNGYRVPSLYERLGTFYSSFSQDFTALGDPGLKPERSVAVDAGIDQEFADGRARISATWFYTRLTDTIGFGFPVPDIGTTQRPFGGYLNEKGGIARGVELSAAVSPARSTYVFASYTRTNSDQRVPQVAGSGVLRTLGIPDDQFTLLVTQNIAKRLDISFDLLVSGDYLAPVFSNQTFTTVIYRFGGNRRGDLSAAYEIRLPYERLRLTIGGVVQNVFGEEYFENGFRTEGRTARAALGLRF